MRRWGIALLLLASSVAAEDSARRALAEGERNFREKKFDAAIEQFEKAARKAPDEKLDPAVAIYNLGNALAEAGRLDEAAARYQEAMRSPDLKLQAATHYNRGNVLYRLAESATTPEAARGARERAQEALQMYERAILLDPADEDAKVNYELTARLIQQLEQLAQSQPEGSGEQSPQQQPSSEEQQEQADRQESAESGGEQEQQQRQPQEGESQPQPQPGDRMTPEEALMMLDRLRQEEQAYRELLRVWLGQPEPVEKDW